MLLRCAAILVHTSAPQVLLSRHTDGGAGPCRKATTFG